MHNHAFLALCLQSYWYLVLQHTPVWCCLIIWSTSRLPLQMIHFMQENKTELFKHCFHNACSWGLNKIACHYTVKIDPNVSFCFPYHCELPNQSQTPDIEFPACTETFHKQTQIRVIQSPFVHFYCHSEVIWRFALTPSGLKNWIN